MDLSIVIVNYNSTKVMKQLINSIPLSCNNLDYEIIIIDNNSEEIFHEEFKETFKQNKLIINTENRGFGAACNQGMKVAQGKYIALVNPDIILKPGSLHHLYEYLEKQDNIAIAGPQILNSDGSIEYSCRRFPTLNNLFYAAVGLDRLFPNSKELAAYRMRYWSHNEEKAVDQIIGACMVMRRQLVEAIGYFDERFFMYYEEVDLCKRMHDRNYKIMYLPEVKVIHGKGESAATDIGNALCAYYQSQFKYFKKHFSILAAYGSLLTAFLEKTIRLLVWSIRKWLQPANRKASIFVKGYWAAIIYPILRK